MSATQGGWECVHGVHSTDECPDCLSYVTTHAETVRQARMTCEKCGSDDVLTRWHGKGAYHESRYPQPCHGDYGPSRGKPKGEHLHYHCRNCQFDWTGPVLAGQEGNESCPNCGCPANRYDGHVCEEYLNADEFLSDAADTVHPVVPAGQEGKPE